MATAITALPVCAWSVDQQTATFVTFKHDSGLPFRAMVFTGTPSPAALAAGVPVVTDATYLGVCQDAGNVAATDPATGAPWAGAWSGGIGATGRQVDLAGALFVYPVVCDRMLAFAVYGTTGWSFIVFGECIVAPTAPATGIWAGLATGLTWVDPTTGMDAVLASPLPFKGAGQPCGTYYAGGQRGLQRGLAVAGVGTAPLSAVGSDVSYLAPITVMGSELVGHLRQMRIGPYGAGRRRIRDSLGNPRAIRLNGGFNQVGSGLYLDQLP
jgi:hypothetical protein